jgi:hypothetical protein
LSSKLSRPASTTRLPPAVYATLDQLPTVSSSAAHYGLAVNGSLNSVQPIDLRATWPASPDRAGLTLRSLAALKAYDPTPDTVLLSAQEAQISARLNGNRNCARAGGDGIHIKDGTESDSVTASTIPIPRPNIASTPPHTEMRRYSPVTPRQALFLETTSA